jgi:RHS repeat-associated protein
VEFLFAFTARERDVETGLQYHRARYYDPTPGRWLSEDPIGFSARDPNLAPYVTNATTNRVDPSGHKGLPDPDTLAVGTTGLVVTGVNVDVQITLYTGHGEKIFNIQTVIDAIKDLVFGPKKMQPTNSLTSSMTGVGTAVG